MINIRNNMDISKAVSGQESVLHGLVEGSSHVPSAPLHSPHHTLPIQEVEKEVNPHFEDLIFNWEHNKYVIVGAYGSSKSYHVALKIILKCLEEKRKVLVIREVYETIRDSCYDLFEEIIGLS